MCTFYIPNVRRLITRDGPPPPPPPPSLTTTVRIYMYCTRCVRYRATTSLPCDRSHSGDDDDEDEEDGGGGGDYIIIITCSIHYKTHTRVRRNNRKRIKWILGVRTYRIYASPVLHTYIYIYACVSVYNVYV